MYKKLIFLLTLFSASLFIPEAKAQDPEFSQFYANPLYLNPAFTGAPICPRLILNYRNQWPSLAKSYVTYNFSYDQYVEKIHGGLGLLVNLDNAGSGILNTTQASVLYSYRLRAAKNFYMNMAVQGTFLQRGLSWDKLLFEDQIDPQLGFVNPTNEKPPDKTSVIAPDFSAGIVFDWNSILFGGVAVNHLTEPDLAFYNDNNSKLDMKITGHLGLNIPIKSGTSSFTQTEEPKFSISPNLLYQQQGPWHQINAGIYFNMYYFVIGGWFRHNFENADAAILLVGLTYSGLHFGYSYDLTMSKLKNNTGGAHEVSVSYQFPCVEKKRRLKAIKSPNF